MRTLRALVGAAALATVPLSASAGLVFSDVEVGGSLSSDFVVRPQARDIDFEFPFGFVGDVTDPIRDGTLTISFIVTGTEGEVITKDILSVLGAAEGRGLIQITETVEDLAGGQGQIASLFMNINSGNPPPRDAEIVFTSGSTKIKVTKSIALSAIATSGTSLASVSLIEQTFVPAPATVFVAALAGLAGMRRRRP